MYKSEQHYSYSESQVLCDRANPQHENATFHHRKWLQSLQIGWQQVVDFVTYRNLGAQQDDQWWYLHGREVGTGIPHQYHSIEELKAWLEEIYQYQESQDSLK